MSFTKARHRTKGERQLKPDDAREQESRILDEQEQEREITELRVKNRSDNVRAQNVLDVGLLSSAFFSILQLLKYIRISPPLTALSILQLAFIPLSLTPYYLPPSVRPVSRYHLYIWLTHCALFLIALQELRSRPLVFGEVARWALPGILACVVEVQRRGETDVLRKLDELEASKYHLKGV
ncbi:hypothetical protein TREMEDRAFT_59749 [Tremella mesenterica DSM 1558]|uniref:uncharacterized protein n=1 Tax=Tremella mesenterica (strain ATCC 24925 / CBS 8224 / DSM 1558 / NBRC 9311 / NRRL Y-6157 / RJB 2259-6 / UBC 559-6) TaxID=578456 RepID=UPI0003F495B6|nr:uncharacterized protein TREMEDRAFT_59749 [Tremella mesenterica DSM 1558]EIW73574.1 hypothetical protein TREMEDRAFT_59749 [Tremella mesenterica DSM 1558]